MFFIQSFGHRSGRVSWQALQACVKSIAGLIALFELDSPPEKGNFGPRAIIVNLESWINAVRLGREHRVWPVASWCSIGITFEC